MNKGKMRKRGDVSGRKDGVRREEKGRQSQTCPFVLPPHILAL